MYRYSYQNANLADDPETAAGVLGTPTVAKLTHIGLGDMQQITFLIF